MAWKDKGRPPDVGRWWTGGKWGRYGFHRHPRTTQERRFWDDELGRKKRSPRHLPQLYDDLIRTVQKSWKEHRRTQYIV